MELVAELAAARERFIQRNPRSRDAHEIAAAAMPGGNTRTTLFYGPFPVTMVAGAGCRMTDLDGHEYVDMLGEYTAGLYGHSNPVIRAAIDTALDGGWNFGSQGTNEARLAQLICDRFPTIERVRFTNSGTEANLMALGTARAHTGRSRILVFDGAYHGGVLSFGGGGIAVNAPFDWLLGTYNDTASTEALVEANASELAAILVEPMIGSGGCIPATAEFLTTLRRLADQSGALLIFDEVMTSRMSAGGMQQRLGIRADLTTLGKYIGGGMSFGAFGGRADLMAMYDPREPGSTPHAGTFNNNVLSMAAGYAGMSQIFTADVADALFERGETLRANLNTLGESRRSRLRWTGLGSLMTAHFQLEPISAPGDARPQPELSDLFHLSMLERGYYLARRGMLALSLEIGQAEIEGFTAAVDGFLTDYADLVGEPIGVSATA
ncbi:MAG: aminotransferase class III-fold pyridoxal phosphate-dependent enzyme [Pseudolysinimonas sp.]